MPMSASMSTCHGCLRLLDDLLKRHCQAFDSTMPYQLPLPALWLSQLKPAVPIHLSAPEIDDKERKRGREGEREVRERARQSKSTVPAIARP